MEYRLKVMKILYVLAIDCPQPYGEGPAGTFESEKWESNDFDCKNEILNHLDNSFYGVFSNFKSAKEYRNLFLKNTLLRMWVPKSILLSNFLVFK